MFKIFYKCRGRMVNKVLTNFSFANFGRFNNSYKTVGDNIRDTDNIDSHLELNNANERIDENSLFKFSHNKQDKQEKHYDKPNSTFKEKKDTPSKEDTVDTEKPKNDSEYIYGRQACEAVLQSGLRPIDDIYILFTYRVSPPEKLNNLIELAKKKGLKIKYASKQKMDKFSNGKNHNGIVLKCKRKKFIEIKKLSEVKDKYLKKEKGIIILIIDRISDYQNVGTLLRTGVYLGADVLMFSKNDRPNLSSQIAKVSGGASEILPILSIKFIKEFLTQAHKEGFVVISAGADKDNEEERNHNEEEREEFVFKEDSPTSIQCRKVSLYEIPNDLKDKNLIVLLSTDPEAHAKSCDYQVYIPPLVENTKFSKIIDSMNVGVTAALVLSYLRQKVIGTNK